MAALCLAGLASMGMGSQGKPSAGEEATTPVPGPRSLAADRFLNESGRSQVFFDGRRPGKPILKVEESARGSRRLDSQSQALRVDYDSGNHWGVTLVLPGKATPGVDWMLRLQVAAAEGQQIQVNLIGSNNKRVPLDRFEGNGRWREVIFDLDESMPSPVHYIEFQAIGGQGSGWFEVKRAEFFL